jgi:hypothetical protein
MVKRATVARLAVFDEVRPTPGATPPYTANSDDLCWTGATLALKPHG